MNRQAFINLIIRGNVSLLFSLLVACSIILPAAVTAQNPPDAIFKIGGQVIGQSYPSTMAPPTWSYSGSHAYGTSEISGSRTGDSITLSSSITLLGTPPGYNAEWHANHTVEIFTRGRSTATFTATTNAEVSVERLPSGIPKAAFIGIPFGNNSKSVSTTDGPVSDFYSGTSSKHVNPGCGGASYGGPITLPEFPGVEYRKHYSGSSTVGSRGELYSPSYSRANSDGTVVITVQLGNSDPVAKIVGPKVGSVVEDNPAPGASVKFESGGSYDPDDAPPGEPKVYNICAWAWTLKDPDGIVIGTSTSSTYTKTLPTKTGPYTVDLTVTDNEGATNTVSRTFTVGIDRGDCIPHTKKIPIAACSDNKVSITLDPQCGKATVTSHDPTATRGAPLKNEIFLASRPDLLPRDQWMGNSSFTYGMQILFVDRGEGGGISNPNRVIVDGEGLEYDFGISGATTPVTRGVYSILTDAGTGYILSGAGAPDEIYKAGNYSYEFDAAGYLQSVTDPNGNIQNISYGAYGPETVTDTSSGRTIEFGYNSNGKIETVTENGGYAVREISYDSNDQVTGIVTKDSNGNTIRSLSITYNGAYIATVTRDGDPATTATFTYVDGGHGKMFANIIYPTSSTGINYFAPVSGSVRSSSVVSNTKGGATTYEYSVSGNLLSIRLPTHVGAGGNTLWSFSYDANRNRLTESNGTSTWTYTYNNLGLVTQRADSNGRYRSFTYNGADLVQINDNAGVIAKLRYTDPALPHAVTEIEDGAGNVWQITRNSFGQITAVTPPAGSPTSAVAFDYEENTGSPYYGYLKTITNGEGDQVTIDSYTPLGDPTSITTYPASGVSRTVLINYDATQREVTVTHPDGKSVQTDYAGSNAVAITDEAGTTFNYDYCAECGKLTGISGPLSWAVSWVLDGDKDIVSFADALTSSTAYTYGAAGELAQITYPDGTTLKYRYGNSGRLNKIINGRNTTLSYSFDASGNITNDGIYSYTYNSSGNLATSAGAKSNVAYAYNSNRLVSNVAYNFSFAASAVSAVQHVAYTYNPDQTINTITWKSGAATVAQWTYGYDGAGRVVSITNNFGETTTYTYDGEGKILTQANQNGTSREYTYSNLRGWPVSIVYKNGGVTTSSYGLTYDSGSNTAGNLTGITEYNGDTVSYDYDALYRLTEETRSASPSYSRTYVYDLAGNVTAIDGTAFGVFDSANKMTSVLSSSVTHDNDGNLTSIASSPFPFSAAEWTSDNKLSRATITTGDYIEYYYRYDGKRFYSKPSNSSTRTLYVFAGDLLIGEIRATTSGYTLSAAYTWGPDGLVSRRDISGSGSLWYEFGPQGETRAITNGSGAVTDTYTYNAYGETIASTGSSVNPFRYGGKYGYYTEGMTGLLLATQRWYSPGLIRWVSRDPIGYKGGVNLYEYGGGNPVKYIDPDGLDITAIGAGGAFSGAATFGRGVVAGTTMVGPATVGGVAVVGGFAIYCYLYPDDCAAAYEGFCEANNINPNVLNEDKFRGGKKGKRDKNRGVRDRDFWDWWHEEGKESGGYDGKDIPTEEIPERYQDWVDQGKPKAPKPRKPKGLRGP